MAKSIGIYLRKAFTLVLFMGISAFTLFFAYGYQYDFKKQDIRKTSIIDIIAKDKDVQVLFEGKLTAMQIPYQIKGVVPGRHVVEVKKDGYEPWQRQVEVLEDIVTIVNDVILVPVDPGKFVKPLMAFSEKNARYYYGDNFIAELLPDERALKVISLYGNGTIKDEDIELFKAGIDSIEPLEGENFLIYFSDGGTAWVSFGSKRFVFFNLPAGAERIKVNADKGYLYYLLDGDLFGVPLEKVDGLEKAPDDFRLVGKVDAFATGLDGDLYFLSSGKLYRADYRGKGGVLVETVTGDYVNIGIKTGRNFGALILRDKDEKRYLWVMDRAGEMVLLEDDLKGEPFFDSYDDLLYASGSGGVYYYDNILARKKIVSKQSGDFTILGWFSDEGHFVQREDNKVILNDIYNANRYILLEDVPKESQVFVPGKSLFFIKDNTLDVLNWLKQE
jgi:hypothetical protein